MESYMPPVQVTVEVAQNQTTFPGVQRYDHLSVVKAEPVSMCYTEPVNASTMTQDVFVPGTPSKSCAAQRSPAPSPKTCQVSAIIFKSSYESPSAAAKACPTPQPRDEISFAGDGDSVVIQHTPLEQKSATNLPADQEKSAMSCLVDAAEGKSLEALLEAIRQAIAAGISPELIEWAHSRREKLEAESFSLNMHRTAAQALQEALRGNSTDLLQSAFQRAQSIGVQGSLFDKARDELKRRQLRRDAEEALYAALHGVGHGTPFADLARAVDCAAAAGVSPDLVNHARRRFTEVEASARSQHVSLAAEQRLIELVESGGDVEALSVALEAAQEAGACLKIIESARKKKTELEERAWGAQTRDVVDRRPEPAFCGYSTGEVSAPTSQQILAMSSFPQQDTALSTGTCSTPASTIGIVGDVREELHKIMRMPTRPLEDEEATSPARTAILVSSSPQHARAVAPPSPHDVACMSAVEAHPKLFPSPDRFATAVDPSLSLTAMREPASEPTVNVEQSVERTPCSVRMEIGQLNETADTTALVHTLGEDQAALAPRSSWRPSTVADDLPPVYGLDAELKAKAEAKYDTTAEHEAAQWVQDITGVQVVGEFGEALRTGQVLCQLVNCIQPGTIKKINNAGMPFKERENISKFLKACRSWGVHEYALFSTDDLYDEKNLLSVVKCIHQLGGVLQRSVPEFQGPHLGVADTSNAKRDQKRALEQASQTGGLHAAMSRSHVDVMSTGNVRGAATRGGC